MVVETYGLKDHLDGERFENLPERVREMIMDDEERVYTGSYGPRSFRMQTERRVLQVDNS